MAPDDLSVILPRVVIVSRRTLRKNKFVDFVGEYHLDLIVGYGAVPVIVPRVSGIETVLESFEPIHGVLLCEGEDIDPSWYLNSEDVDSSLSPEEVEEIRRLHVSDTAVDKEKDSIELRLAKLCLDRNIPYLGICRGSQVLNVACGGTLYQDIGKEVSRKLGEDKRVVHMDYDNYDGHRHPIRVVDGTPLHTWFNESLQEMDSPDHKLMMMVNSYHHQGVKRLAPRFVPMAFAPDGVVEGYYDPNMYDPDEGKFVMGLQFHPERMRHPESGHFDYPGCPVAYEEFVRAVIAYQKKIDASKAIPKTLKLNVEIENKRKVIVRSFSLAKDLYLSGTKISKNKEAPVELKAGAEFLESNTLSSQQEVRLKEMGATVRNAHSYFERLKVNEERENVARKIMGRMSVEQLTDLMSFYHMMGKICGEVVERKLLEVVNDHVSMESSKLIGT